MRLSFLDEKNSPFVPAFLVLLVFFTPISTSIKSILLIVTPLVILLTPYYRHLLYYAFKTIWVRAAFLLFLFVLIACFWSEATFSLQYNIINKYSKLLFLPIFTVGFARPKTRLWVLNAYIIVMLLTCICSIIKSFTILFIYHPDPGQVFFNHIITGFMVALGVYFAGLLALDKSKSRRWRILYLSMVVLGSYQTFFINPGRTGYIIYGILATLFIVQKFPLKKAFIGLVLFTVAIGLTFILSPVMKEGTRALMNDIKLLKHHQADTSLGFRIQFHQYAQSLFEKHPILGVGTGGFQYNFVKDQPIPSWGHKLNEPHSQYWLTLSELGLVGMCFFLLFIGSLFITTFQLEEMKPFLLGFLVSFCVLCFSDTIFCYSTIGHLLIIFSSMCFGEIIQRKAVAQDFEGVAPRNFELGISC